MPTSQSEKLIKMRDGELVLYRRSNSSRWQARYKIPGSSDWLRISTKQSNLDEAKRVAGDEYDRARFRRREGLVPVSKRFRDVATLCIAQLDKEIEAGLGKVAYRDYKQAINNYLIPFFGNKHIDNITQADLTALEGWRREKMKREPAQSTLANHNAALSRIFQLAMDEDWIKKSQVPIIVSRGKRSERRPDFQPEEWKKLVAHFPSWIKKAKTERNRRMRELLRDYVLVLAHTGIRTGTEAYSLKWKQIRWYVDRDKNRFLQLSVNGKTGKRDLIARHGCEDFLKRIQSRFSDLKEMSFDDLLKAKVDQYVFRLSNGQLTTQLHHTFEEFLTDIGLLRDKHGDKRTLYSLRHTYATSRIVVDKVPVHHLAVQMGTSVAMIEKHYSHLKPYMNADMFGGKRYEKKEPDPKPSSENVPQTKKKSRSAS